MIRVVCEIIVVDNNMMVGSARRLYERGEITLEQYATVLRRAKDV